MQRQSQLTDAILAVEAHTFGDAAKELHDYCNVISSVLKYRDVLEYRVHSIGAVLNDRRNDKDTYLRFKT